MFKNNLTKEIVCLLTILAITLPIIGINIAKGKAQEETEQEKLTLELVKEIKFEKSIVDDIGMINIGVITSTEEEKAIRKKAKLSKDEPIFPVRAITIPGKGVVIFDEKGNIKREIKDGCFVSENGEYVVAGNKIKTRENKKALKTKGFRGQFQAISNNGAVVTAEKGDKYPEVRINFYDKEGNLRNTPVVGHRGRYSYRTPRNMFQLSRNGETFATWDDGTLLAFSQEGKKLFSYKIFEEQESLQIDKIRVSPCGRYIVLSVARGGTYTVFPKDYDEKMKKVGEELERLGRAGKLGEGNQSWTMNKYIEAKEGLIKEIVKPKEVYDGPIRNTVYLFSREGNLLLSYDVVFGELAIAFSPEGDYVGVGDYHNVYLFEAETGRLRWKYEEKNISRHPHSISLSSNANYVTVGIAPHAGGSLEERRIKTHNRYIYIFDKTGQLLVKKDIGTTYRGILNTIIDVAGKTISVITDETFLLFKIGGDAQ